MKKMMTMLVLFTSFGALAGEIYENKCLVRVEKNTDMLLMTNEIEDAEFKDGSDIFGNCLSSVKDATLMQTVAGRYDFTGVKLVYKNPKANR